MEKVLKGFLLASLVTCITLGSTNVKAEGNTTEDVEVVLDAKAERKAFEKQFKEIEKELKKKNRKFYEGLTEDDLVRVNILLEETAALNPNISEEELEEVALDQFEELTAPAEEGQVSTAATYFGYTLNWKEVGVCAANPVDCSRVYAAKNRAEESTNSYYWTGFHNGNADAYRHAYWNLLMTQAIGPTEAKKFADAHEFGASKQPQVEEDMDLYNNAKGRSYGTNVNNGASYIKSKVNGGYMKRIVSGNLAWTNSYGSN